MLFANLWNVEAVRDSMTSSLQELFHKWLQDNSTTNWADWLMSPTKDNLSSMYLLTNSDTFKSKSCSQIQILKDISNTYPDIIQFNK
jgi:hypothetical protein